MKLFILRVLALFALALPLAASALADSLELRDGRILKGTYQGGTQNSIRFLVDGKTETFNVTDVLALTFESKPVTTPPTSEMSQPASTASTSTTESASTLPLATGTITVPAGTTLLVRMIDTVDSEKSRIGERFRASLETDLEIDGAIVAPKGADVYGRLAEAKGAGRMTGKAQLTLELTELIINGRTFPIISSDYEVSGKARGGETAKRTIGGAAIGAVIGAIAGGGKGAAIGAGVGGGAGAASTIITRGEQVRVPSETLLEFRLEQPVTIKLPASN